MAGGTPSRSPITSGSMRSGNLETVLRHLHTPGRRSRARLAQETGFSRSAMSSIIGELVQRGLVREGSAQRDGTVGRPGTDIEVTPGRVAGVGLEVSADHLALLVLDLAGEVLMKKLTPLPRSGAGEGTEVLLDAMAAQLREALALLDERSMLASGLPIAPPGVIDPHEGTVLLAPHLGWTDVPLRQELRRRLGPGCPAIDLENDAKLSALATAPPHVAHGVGDLVFLTGDVGVGAGIIAGGALVRGWSGLRHAVAPGRAVVPPVGVSPRARRPHPCRPLTWLVLRRLARLRQRSTPGRPPRTGPASRARRTATVAAPGPDDAGRCRRGR
ncbi:ROK family transcriptional regulator [Brachybacterium sp. EF45031]|nr:ROK family transcriptional regulator [Brachybacterium sillae]